MKEFKRSLALTGACLAGFVGTLGVGEYANDVYTDNLRSCDVELENPGEVATCKEEVGPDTDSVYGVIVIGLGAASLFFGFKSYKAHEAETQREQDYLKTEGFPS